MRNKFFKWDFLFKFLKNNIVKRIELNEKQYKIILFNIIKITFLKKNFYEKKKILLKTFNYYKKNNQDITTIPPATGQLRDIQLANLELLKELDYVCSQNNLKYWLNFGSLLGAIRHKGFIPWDDDIDCGMMREDYNKLFKAFEKSCRNPDIIPIYFKPKEDARTCIIKITHKQNLNLFVDIFPFDFYNRKLSDKEKAEKTQIAHQCLKEIEQQVNSSMGRTEFYSIVENIQNNKLLETETTSNVQNPDIFLGLEFPHDYPKLFFNYEDFFPLKKTMFEECDLPIINNPDAFLSAIYGDYMAYPRKIGTGHNSLRDFTDSEIKVIKELIDKKENKLEVINEK